MNTQNTKDTKNTQNETAEKAVQTLDTDALDEVVGGGNPFADVPRTDLKNLDDPVRANG